MIFVLHIIIAFLLVTGGALATIFRWIPPDLINVSFLASTIAAQIWLFVWALILRSRRIPKFDMLVASEIIITFGIFSLILGIVISSIHALQDTPKLVEAPFQILKVALVPFAEGLLASGLAPLLATLLRQIEVLRYGVDSTAERENEPDLQGLADKVTQVIAALDDFVGAWRRSEIIIKGVSETLIASADTYSRAAQQIEEALNGLAIGIQTTGKRATDDINGSLGRLSAEMETISAKVPAHIENAVLSLAGDLRGAGASVVGELRKTSTGLNNLLDRANNQVSTVARAFEDLAAQARAFSNAASEGTTLLTGLQRLIDSVTNFVRPADAPTR
jgi:methyl-accepting chemotaxis protein